MAEHILEIIDFHYSYGEIKAVKGINMTVDKGEIVTLIGSNGAGKSTTLGAISAIAGGSITKGEIRFMGKKINGMSDYKIASLGIAQCIEGRHIFSQLTVHENLMMGAYRRKFSSAEVKHDLEYVFNLFPRLKEREKQHGGTLSGGEQQMLCVGRALMQRPQILLMDEPSLGLAPLVVQDIFSTIKKINEDGVPVLLIEQNSKAALGVAHRGYVMETGNIVMEDQAANLANNEDVQKVYLGIE